MVQTLTEKIKFIESVFGPGKLAHNAKNIDVRCPICTPRDPSKKKLAILVEDGRVHCWTCGFKSASLAPLIRKHGTQSQFAEYVRTCVATNYNRKSFQDDTTTETIVPRAELPKDFKLLALVSDVDYGVKNLKNYLYERGLTQNDLWYYKFGFSLEPRWSRRIIMPSFDAFGDLNYFVGRAVDKFKQPKYDNPDLDKNPIIFNEINIDWSKRLVICEGPFDLTKCGDNAVPLLGSNLNEQSSLFNSILIRSTPVALALDADMWSTKTPRIAQKLSQYDIDVTIVDTRPFDDPGNASKEQFKQALSEARPFSWLDMFKNKLARASHVSLSK